MDKFIPGKTTVDLRHFQGGVSDEAISKIVKSIIANQVALDFNEAIKHTVYYKHNLKRLLKPVITELIKIEEGEFDDFLENVKSTVILHSVYSTFVEEAATLKLEEYGDIIKVIRAYKKNKASVMGIAKKLNKK